MTLRLLLGICVMNFAYGTLTIQEMREQIAAMQGLTELEKAEYKRIGAAEFHKLVCKASFVAARARNQNLSDAIDQYLASESYERAKDIPGVIFPIDVMDPDPDALYRCIPGLTALMPCHGNKFCNLELALINFCKSTPHENGGPFVRFFIPGYETLVMEDIKMCELSSPVGVQILSKVISMFDSPILQSFCINCLGPIFRSAAAGGFAIPNNILASLMENPGQIEPEPEQSDVLGPIPSEVGLQSQQPDEVVPTSEES